MSCKLSKFLDLG
jgi:hypothetical protein